MIVGVTGFAAVVGAAGAPTVPVVLCAQVVNGILLPVVALCLVLCVEAPRAAALPPLGRSLALVPPRAGERSRPRPRRDRRFGLEPRFGRDRASDTLA